MKDFHSSLVKFFFSLFVIFNLASAQNGNKVRNLGPESVNNQIIKTATNQDNKIKIRITNQ